MSGRQILTGTPAAPSRRRGGRRPRVVLGLGALVVGGLLIASPARGALLEAVPSCPFRALTGWDCPFCGGTRAALALMHGDLAAAADYNLLVTVATFLAAGLLVSWSVSLVRPSWTWPGPSLARSRGALRAGVAVVCVFWFVRNLPLFPYLATAT